MLPRSAVHRAAHADGVAFGADAVELLNNRKVLDDETFFAGMKEQFGL